MPPKARRTRGRRAQGRRAPQRLDQDLKRHQLARTITPQLVAAAERFLDHFPRIVQRRARDRIGFLADLASDVLAWTALGAPRDESHLPLRCFAASCKRFSKAGRGGGREARDRPVRPAEAAVMGLGQRSGSALRRPLFTAVIRAE